MPARQRRETTKDGEVASHGQNGNGNGNKRQTLSRFNAVVADVPFYRKGQNGRQSVATIRAVLTDKEGNALKDARVIAWGQLAKESAVLAEGDEISVTGAVQPPRSYEGRDGNMVTVDNEIAAADIDVIWGDQKIAIEDFDRDALMEAAKTIEQDPGPDMSIV